MVVVDGEAGMGREFVREGIARMRRVGDGVRRAQRGRRGRPPSHQLFDHGERRRLQARAVAGEVEPAGGVAEESVAEQVTEQGKSPGTGDPPDRLRRPGLSFAYSLPYHDRRRA
jgi:hypothetical protein